LAELASGYRHRQGRLVRVLRPWPWTPWGPAGALRSNARDLLHYTAAYLGAEQAGDVAVPLELSRAMALARAPADVKLVDGSGSQAYAWVVRNADNPARSMVYKNGGTAGYSSCIALWPAGKTGVVLLMNSSKTHACKKGLALLRILAGPPQKRPGR
ncbi:MAG TPA: serine hydrolase, partial [Gammaproteobacteria bacterium]|nr:serine hydrolase [Gammaproteobacteria bacterium]